MLIGGAPPFSPSFPGDKDARGGGGPLRSALDALPHFGPDQLICVYTLPECLVPALLSDLHLRQQRHQPPHLQPHVTEVPLRLSAAIPLQADGGILEDVVSGPGWAQRCPGASTLPE